MIRASDCPLACSALAPSNSSAARFHDVIQPWPSVVTIASPAAAIAADARAGSAVVGWPSAVDIEVSLALIDIGAGPVTLRHCGACHGLSWCGPAWWLIGPGRQKPTGWRMRTR